MCMFGYLYQIQINALMETSSPLSSCYISHSQESQQGNTMEENMDERSTMSVELAIQRELAYRRKIRELQLLPRGDSGDETMPEQVQFVRPNPSRPKLSPRFSENQQPASVCNPEYLLSSRPIQSSSSRPKMSASLRIPGTNQLESSSKCLQPRELVVVKDGFFCKICRVPCSGSSNYKQHIRGKKHNLKLQELKIREKSHNSGAMSNQKLWCNLCKIWCIDDSSMKQHLLGQKHMKMQEKLKQVTTAQGYLSDEQNRCDLCGIECTSKELLRSHYYGKRHQIELRKLDQCTQQKGRGDEQNQPKRCKVCKIRCADKISSQRHQREKNDFFYEVEEKKRQWIDLIRDEGNC